MLLRTKCPRKYICKNVANILIHIWSIIHIPRCRSFPINKGNIPKCLITYGIAFNSICRHTYTHTHTHTYLKAATFVTKAFRRHKTHKTHKCTNTTRGVSAMGCSDVRWVFAEEDEGATMCRCKCTPDSATRRRRNDHVYAASLFTYLL